MGQQARPFAGSAPDPAGPGRRQPDPDGLTAEAGVTGVLRARLVLDFQPSPVVVVDHDGHPMMAAGAHDREHLYAAHSDRHSTSIESGSKYRSPSFQPGVRPRRLR